jgi:hypothetical protein
MSNEAICLAVQRLAGLSWGNPRTRVEMSRLLAPWDPEAVAVEMASGQSNCAVMLCAALLIAQVDGLVRNWRGRPLCNPLTSPRAGHYDAIMYLEHLALERHARRTVGQSPPDIRPGVWYQLSGPYHVEAALSAPDAAGLFEVGAGGQPDALNPRTGAANCTAIVRKLRRLGGGPGRWTVDGRPLVYTCDAGQLPTCGDGMPWAAIGVEP